MGGGGWTRLGAFEDVAGDRGESFRVRVRWNASSTGRGIVEIATDKDKIDWNYGLSLFWGYAEALISVGMVCS